MLLAAGGWLLLLVLMIKERAKDTDLTMTSFQLQCFHDTKHFLNYIFFWGINGGVEGRLCIL